MSGWVACIKQQNVAALGALRQMPGIEVMSSGEAIWMRGDQPDEIHGHAIRTLPGVQRFQRHGHDELIPVGACLPVARIPNGAWISLRQWLLVRKPAAAFGGVNTRAIPIRLTRADLPAKESAANILVTAFDQFANYCESVSELRLKVWQFAVSDRGRVIVRGRPLPPLPGQQFVESASVAVPVGFVLSPSVDQQLIRRNLAIEDGGLAIVWPDQTLNLIPSENLVAVTRSGVRETKTLMGLADA